MDGSRPGARHGQTRGRVLVVDDDPDLQFLLEHALAAEHLETVLVDSASTGLAALDTVEGAFDCVVLDLMLPDSAGLDTLRRFAAETDLPIVIVSGLVDLPVITEARRLGVVDYVVKSWDTPERLGTAVNAILEARHASGETEPHDVNDAFSDAVDVLLDDVQNLIPMSQWLLARQLDTGWAVVQAVGDPLVDLARRIGRDDPLLGFVPSPGEIVFRSLESDEAMIDLAAETRIRGYIAAPIIADARSRRVYGALIGLTSSALVVSSTDQRWFGSLVRTFEGTVRVELARNRVERRAGVATVAARLDVLTKLGNRRAWEHAIAVEESRCARYGHGATIACVDLDRLKIVNDRLGHAAGDQLLRHTATVLRDTIRGSDSAYRVGGDEFTVLSIETEPGHTDEIRDRLRTALDDAGIAASVGAAFRHADTTLTRTWRAADASMYRQKDERRRPST